MNIAKGKDYSYSKFIIGFLLFLVFIQTLYGIHKKSVTWDERCFIGSGDYIFKTKDFRLNTLLYHPPLSYYISSIFLSFLEFDKSMYKNADCWEFGNNIIFHSKYKPETVVFLARLPIALLSVILAFFVFKWAKSMYGLKSGLMALVLYTFNTTILSYGGLALTDFVATFFIFITLYCFWLYIQTKLTRYTIMTGLFLGLALMSKATSIIIMPSLIIAGYFYSKQKYFTIRQLAKNLAVVLLISMLTMYIGYGFRFGTLDNKLDQHYYKRAHEEIDKLPFTAKKILTFLFRNVPLPFPNYFAELGSVAYYSNLGVNSFVFGKVTDQAVWYLPLVILLFKVQLALLVFFIISLFTLNKRNFVKEFIVLLPIILIFVLFMLNNRTSGIRHLLGIFPFIFVFSSRLLSIKLFKKKIFWAFVGILLLHYILSTLLVAPHYLAYYNELAGGPENGYKYIVGSNVDLGQDLPELKDYMEKNNIAKIKFSYFGSVDPKDYNITYEYLASPYFQYWVPDFQPFVTLTTRYEDCSEKNGYIAISVNNLQNVHLINKTCFNWLKKHEPVAKIGYSIFVYNISNK